MRAACCHGPRDIEVVERPDPTIQEPTDAVVRVVMGSVCGSDLWDWRGVAEHAEGSIGHEFIGVVTEVGSEVGGLRVGALVIAPSIFSDLSCPHCLNGSTISCVRGGTFGNGTIDGGQGEAVRHRDPVRSGLLRNVGWRGGPAPSRLSIPELMRDVFEGRIDPGLVFDHETDLDRVVDAYTAMDERSAIKSLLRIGSL